MPCQAALNQLIPVLNATPIQVNDPTQRALRIITDTRSLQPGDLFVALRGETFDGHEFLTTAAEKGAIAAIVDTAYTADPPPLPLLQVPNTIKAYQAIARWWRDQFDIPVIGITGSVGKTTTKELIAAALSTQGTVLKSQANFNNEIGVPKTLLELGPEHDFAIIEMGMRGRGQIAELAQTANPTIGIISNVGTAHIGILGSEEAIAQAKCELLAEMQPTGTAILNFDCPLLVETSTTVWHGKRISYGLTQGDLHGIVQGGTVTVHGTVFPVPLPGDHNALNYLAVIGVFQTLGLPLDSLKAGLVVDLPGGRAKRIELPNDIVLLDETYNAGLESMLASLKLLSQTPGTRRIAVLGTMKELGDRSPEFHRRVGAEVQHLGIHGLLILADPSEAEAMAVGAQPLQAEKFNTHAEVVARLQELVQPGDRILFKASRAVGLDKVVEGFRATL